MESKQQNTAQKEQLMKLKKQKEELLRDIEQGKKKELDALQNKCNLEVNELEIKLKCTVDEYQEFKMKINEKIVIEGNNKDLLIENLRRENEALCNELSGYRQNAKTL